MSDYFVEIVVGDSVQLSTTATDTTILEFGGGPIQPPWQIGGTDPTSNPSVLVWFDTQGA